MKIYSDNRICWPSHLSASMTADLRIIVTETFESLHSIETHLEAYVQDWVQRAQLFCITGEYETSELDWDGQEDNEIHDFKSFVWSLSEDDALSNLPARGWVSGPYVQFVKLDRFDFLQADLPAPKR